MKLYVPQYVGTVTKYVFIDSPSTTPQDIATTAYEISKGMMIKETCFGCQITGNPEDVDRITTHLRKLDPYHIFIKDRGFPPGDARRCRADLGGARPGYLGHEYEMSLVQFISYGLKQTEKMTEEELTAVACQNNSKPKWLDINLLKSILMEE
ncbi:MAG TPA: methanogenesis marker 6 protein [Methanocorpusculum sp.]|nr:methanogenesis marker 6 protein [Methanocorpusculum sp.]